MAENKQVENRDELLERMMKIDKAINERGMKMRKPDGTIEELPFDEDAVNQDIRELQQAVDYHVTTKSKEYNGVVEDYLEQYGESYDIPDVGGFTPLEDFDGNPSPITSQGLATKAVMDSYEGMVDSWSRLSSFDSIEAFEDYRSMHEDGMDDMMGHPGASLTSSQIMKHALAEPDSDLMHYLHDSFDDVSVDKLDEVANIYLGKIHDLTYDSYADYSGFVHSDPEMAEREDSQEVFINTVLKGEDYAKRQNDAILSETLYFNRASHMDFSKSSLSKTKDYEQLLYGLYDNDADAVYESGLKDAFEDAVDQYFEETGYSLHDLYDEDGTNDPSVNMNKHMDMLEGVSMNMGFSLEESRDFVNLLDYEERMYLEKGQMYASRGGEDFTAKGDPSDRFKWVPEHFESIYGQPMDYNVDYKRHLDAVRQDEDMTQDELQDMAQEFGYAEDSDPANDLFDVSLNKRMEPSYGSTKENVSQIEQMGLLLERIQNKEPLNDDDYSRTFEYEVDRTMADWDASESDLRNDPELFKDWMTHTTDRTISKVSADEATLGQGRHIVTDSIGHDIQTEDVDRFVEGYKASYGAPIDAWQKSVNEVFEEMDQEPTDDILGRVSYTDVKWATSATELDNLREQEYRKIDHDKEQQRQAELELEREVEKQTDDYFDHIENDLDDEGPSF